MASLLATEDEANGKQYTMYHQRRRTGAVYGSDALATPSIAETVSDFRSITKTVHSVVHRAARYRYNLVQYGY